MDIAIHDADAPPIAAVMLHDYPRSSASYRVRIGLALKGIPYARRTVDLLAGEQRGEAYRAANPQGFVPMLEMDGLRLTQSLAILNYLDARHPMPPFLPIEPAERAHVEALALTIACDIHPLNNLRVLGAIGDLGADEAAQSAWYGGWIADGFAALEALAAPHAGDYLHGDAPTLADILLVPQMFNARRRTTLSLDAYPTLVRADASAAAHPAFAAAHPDKVAATA